MLVFLKLFGLGFAVMFSIGLSVYVLVKADERWPKFTRKAFPIAIIIGVFTILGAGLNSALCMHKSQYCINLDAKE